MNNDDKNNVKWFRNAAPYINAHRGKTVVLMFGGEAVTHPNFANIIHDIALLRSLGVKLVLVHGARPQIEDRMQLQNVESLMEENIRITDSGTLSAVKDATGALRIHIEALLTMGLVNSPMHGSQIRVSAGNFVIAKPIGVKNGIDFKHTGTVRRIDTVGINTQLDFGSIVLLSPVGYSSTGEVFNLSLEDVATQTAISLKADKLITFTDDEGLVDQSGKLIKSCGVTTVKALLTSSNDPVKQLLMRAIIQSSENGVERCLGGILELLAPLEEEGILVKRSRELLEVEISRFTVLKKEDVIIACAALYPYPEDNSGEVACVAIHPDYRKGNRGLRLMNTLEGLAREQELSSIFVLTTVSGHWFLEKGFNEQPIDKLPEGKKKMYNFQRNSKVYSKEL